MTKKRISKDEFLAKLAQGQKDFSNLAFEFGMDLRKEIPQGQDTARGLLKGLDFSDSILDDVNFAYIEFIDCNFTHASLFKTNFNSAIFKNCQIDNTALGSACLKHVQIQ